MCGVKSKQLDDYWVSTSCKPQIRSLQMMQSTGIHNTSYNCSYLRSECSEAETSRRWCFSLTGVCLCSSNAVHLCLFSSWTEEGHWVTETQGRSYSSIYGDRNVNTGAEHERRGGAEEELSDEEQTKYQTRCCYVFLTWLYNTHYFKIINQV